jgi:release factor glutamine methyltransferase
MEVTLRDALRAATTRLEQHYVSSPRLNAEVLLAHCLSVDKTYLYTHDERILTPHECERYEEFLYERISGVPVQYIVGRQEFYGRYFKVNRSVLIPRPETEFVVESVLALKPSQGADIIDVGTGSGCIGVTLALELPDAKVTVTDVSLDALFVARENAASLGAAVSIACMDLLDAAQGRFDFVVSNPPYVNPEESSRLQREVREHEPHVALFAGEDVFAMYGRLFASAEGVLKPGGYLISEIGFGMEDRVLSLLSDRWDRLPTRTDLQGIPRTIVARLSPTN